MFTKPQLTEHLKEVSNFRHLFNGTCIGEPKIDGTRTEINAEGVFSRYGNKKGFDSASIGKLLNFLKTANISLDGEFDSNFTDEDGKLLHHVERRYRTMSIMNTQRIPNHSLDKLVFWVFDMIIPQNGYTLRERKVYLEKIVSTLNAICPFEVKMVPYKVINSESDFNALLKFYVESGFEGIVIKRLESSYKPDNRGDWIAFKLRHTSDVPIIRVETGKRGKKNEFKMGNLVVKTPLGEAEIGTGYKDKLREWFYENRELVAGLVVEIEHEGYANDIGNLVNASFIRIRNDKPKWAMSF